ncbi:MAG: helix-turn-helix transcriptional regulator [Clostridia bacterium]|nr:helix-turn-helix transcriptional regulator [Clostridia bacterium]
MDIGNKIVQLREENQMSQTELAELLDVSRQTVSKWERNVCEPEAKRIVQLAKIFHITTDYLLGNERELRHQAMPTIVRPQWNKEKCKEKILKVKTEIVNKVKADKFFYLFLGCLALALLTWWLAWMYSRAHPVVLPNPGGPVYTGLKAHLLGEQWYETKLTVATSCIFFIASIVFLIIKFIKKRSSKHD